MSSDQGFMDKAAQAVAGVVEQGKHALNAGSYKAEETAEKGKYEANKAAAKSSDVPVTDRISSGVSAIGNKMNEKSAEGKKEAEKKQAGL